MRITAQLIAPHDGCGSNQHWETRRPSDRDRIVTTGPIGSATGEDYPSAQSAQEGAIWGSEREPPRFSASNNCKDPLYYYRSDPGVVCIRKSLPLRRDSPAITALAGRLPPICSGKGQTAPPFREGIRGQAHVADRHLCWVRNSRENDAVVSRIRDPYSPETSSSLPSCHSFHEVIKI